MKLKLNCTNKFLLAEVIGTTSVVHIISLHQEGLLLLKEVIYLKIGDKLWVKTIVDAFCPSFELPDGSAALLPQLVE